MRTILPQQTGLKTLYPSKTVEERFADGVVHLVGLVAAAIACTLLLGASAVQHDTALLLACSVYAAGILFSAGISAAYHLLPLHPDRRARLRRIDHAAIYLVIAGTMTPLLLLAETQTSFWILLAIWVFAGVGVLFKIFGSNLDSRWSLVSYLALGWFSLLALPDFARTLPGEALIAIAVGGLSYTIGAFFYRNKALRYRYAIWHAVGLLGAISFFAANWMSVFA